MQLALISDQLQVMGTKGCLTMSIFGEDAPVFRRANGKIVTYKTSTPQHVHQPLVQLIVNELRLRAAGRGYNAASSFVPSTGESAKRTATVMDTVVQKFYKSRSDEFWKRRNWDNTNHCPQS